MATREMKVYLLKHVQYGFETVHTEDSLDAYVRIGAADAVFEMDPPAEQTNRAIKILQEAKEKEMAESQVRVNAIEAQIQSLLAITHEPA